jgi:hypothetical protein
MSQKEATAIVRAQGEKDRQKWEQIRVMAYCSASAFGGVKKSITDFMPFTWDVKNTKDAPLISTEERIQRMKTILKNIDLDVR